MENRYHNIQKDLDKAGRKKLVRDILSQISDNELRDEWNLRGYGEKDIPKVDLRVHLINRVGFWIFQFDKN